MPGVKYEQLSTKQEYSDKDVPITRNKYVEPLIKQALLSLILILVYFSLSIGLTFYQRWLFKDFHYPLTVVLYHLLVKWLLSILVRMIIHLWTGIPQLVLPFSTCIRAVAPTGLASGVDVGFSNWALELVTVSLYTMTKSTTIIFILGFAIFLGLEKKSWSLVLIVIMISMGLVMFTYKATQFDLLGFNFLILASFAAGLRWTFAQILMQKSKYGLNNPINMVYHVQPWMFLSLLPFMIAFEGFGCFTFLMLLKPDQLSPLLVKITIGATIAFAMELTEFLVVTYTSSLTLSIAGIFKEMCILILAVKYEKDELSFVNVIGLVICLVGIASHIIHKIYVMKQAEKSLIRQKDVLEKWDDCNEKFDKLKPNNRVTRETTAKYFVEHNEPLLEPNGKFLGLNYSDSDEVSDTENSRVIFDIIQRRDMIR